jgi:CRP-like cAMP-binding protein
VLDFGINASFRIIFQVSIVSMNNSFLKELENLSKNKSFKKREVVFHLGEKAKSIYRVIQGEVHLYRHNQDGKRVLLYRAYDNDYFAEASLNSDRYHCSAVSMKPSSVQVIDGEAMLRELKVNSEFATAWIANLSSELRRQRASVERLHIKSAEERLKHFILTEGSPWGELHLTGTISELSEIIGINRETLYRTLSKMEKQGILQRKRNIYRLLKI